MKKKLKIKNTGTNLKNEQEEQEEEKEEGGEQEESEEQEEQEEIEQEELEDSEEESIEEGQLEENSDLIGGRVYDKENKKDQEELKSNMQRAIRKQKNKKISPCYDMFYGQEKAKLAEKWEKEARKAFPDTYEEEKKAVPKGEEYEPYAIEDIKLYNDQVGLKKDMIANNRELYKYIKLIEYNILQMISQLSFDIADVKKDVKRIKNKQKKIKSQNLQNKMKKMEEGMKEMKKQIGVEMKEQCEKYMEEMEKKLALDNKQDNLFSQEEKKLNNNQLDQNKVQKKVVNNARVSRIP